jgi:gamma-butyrobetaine dioxygenase
VGGESTFLDGFLAAEELRRRDPDAFAVLTRVPATFQKVHYARDAPVHIVAQAPHIRVAPGGGITATGQQQQPKLEPAVTAVTWAPPFEGRLRVPPEDVGAYYRAYGAFAELLRELEADGRHWVQFRLAPGEIVVFNNRRVLHGRRRFHSEQRSVDGAGQAIAGAAPPSALRSLQGCYVAADHWLSRLLTLRARLGGGSGAAPARRIGNGQLY